MFILFENETLRSRAEDLGSKLLLPIYSAREKQPPIKEPMPDTFLFLRETHLEIQQTESTMAPFFIDFNDKDLHYRIRRSTRKNEALARAVGLKKNKRPVVFDLTAGLGRDAFVLAQLGCSLHLFERNKIIAALLDDGLQRASRGQAADTIKQMTLHTGDAIKILPNVAKRCQPDVLYLDPMFPHRTKTALVKKEMQILRLIVGGDVDSAQLFVEAQKYAKNRVVCKRPRSAPYLNETPPSMSIETKKHRFDVYLLNGNLKLETR